MARKNGGMGATRGIKGSGSIGSANLAAGIGISTDLEGAGTINSAIGQLIVSAVAALTGTGGLTGGIVGSISASANLTGTGSLSAPLGAIAGAEATLAGTGGVSGTLRGTGSMSSDIAPATQVTADVIANAVWNAQVDSYSNPESAGYALANLSGGGGALTTEEHNKLMSLEFTSEQATTLLEIWGRLGLDPSAPLVTGATSITFGDIVMAMTGDATSTTVTRQ